MRCSRAAVSLAVYLAVAACTVSAGGEQAIRPAVVELIRNSRGVRYKVNAKPTGNTATTDILYMLNRMRERQGADSPVVVLVDPRVSIDDIWNLEGIADKAQLNNLRFFVRTRDPGKMVEIKWGPPVPYLPDPSLR